MIVNHADNFFSVQNLKFLDWGPFDFSLEPNSMTCISGVSGSGKSLLLKALADFIDHSGTVLLNGSPSTNYAAHLWRKSVALLPAKSQWWYTRMNEHFKNREFGAQFEKLGLDERLFGEDIGRLSSGELQRFALLRLLENEPQILLLDEPAANLDKDSMIRLENFVIEYLRERPAAALWISHNSEQLQRLDCRNFEMISGKLHEKQDGYPSDLENTP